MTKSVIGLLTGIALEEGHLRRIDEPVEELLPSLAGRLAHEGTPVTVRHLLSMTGGWDWDEREVAEYNGWVRAEDHVEYLLQRGFAARPGAEYRYNSAAVHLLGRVLETVVGESLPSFAQRALFGPMGVVAEWEEFGDGTVNGGSGLDMAPRDLAKLGQLVLQRGWSGPTSLIPGDWVAEMGRRQIRGSPVDRPSAGEAAPLSYGLLWWLDEEAGALFAWGHGGQLIYVLPHLDLVVVVTTDWRAPGFDADTVVPAVFDIAALMVPASNIDPGQ